MANQVIVIGLGQFGMALVEALSGRGVEVLAVDRDEELVQRASAFTDEVVRMDAAERSALAGLAPARRDVCVCAIGLENIEGSILCTALLRELGAPRIVARATDDLHARILRAVGAHEVVNPEREYGFHLAPRFVYQGFLGSMTLGEDLRIAEFRAPPDWVGRTVAQLELRARHGLNVVALRSAAGQMLLPDPARPFEEGDVVVAVGAPERLEELLGGRRS